MTGSSIFKAWTCCFNPLVQISFLYKRPSDLEGELSEDAVKSLLVGVYVYYTVIFASSCLNWEIEFVKTCCFLFLPFSCFKYEQFAANN